MNNTQTPKSVKKQQKKQNASPSKTQRRRARRRGMKSMAPVSSGLGSIRVPKSVSLYNQNKGMIMGNKGLSEAGMAFLKCAFAPPDFAYSRITGVPDNTSVMSVCKKHRYSAPGTWNVASGYDTYIALLPTPGVAYWWLQKTAGTPISSADGWIPVTYSDSGSFFGTSPTILADRVTKFRYVSNHIELIPLVNQMQWSGSIQAFKLPVQVTSENILSGGAGYQALTMTGFNSVNDNNMDQYSGPVINGVYSGCFSTEPTFKYSDIMEGLATLPQSVSGNDFTYLATPPVMNGIPGFDNGFESLVIRVSGVTTTFSAMIKTWACVEYVVGSNNPAYDFRNATPEDALAMDLYKKIISRLPIAVAYTDNDSFWQRVLQAIKTISGGLSFVPGPYGAIAGGVHTITQGIESLL